MFGLDENIAGFSDGTTLLAVMVVAIVLGLRHASDPDHLAAVTTLIASGKERVARRAGMLGLVWGLGHATSLFSFGIPIVLYRAYLPERVQQGAESVVGVVIVMLAVLLLVRWRRGIFDVHRHGDAEPRHAHGPAHPVKPRTRLQAYAIGLIAVSAKGFFARTGFDGRVIRALPAVSASVVLGLGLAMTFRALPSLP